MARRVRRHVLARETRDVTHMLFGRLSWPGILSHLRSLDGLR
jgi:hypothetical protein